LIYAVVIESYLINKNLRKRLPKTKNEDSRNNSAFVYRGWSGNGEAFFALSKVL
jgi:hypothetical protein